MRDPYSTLEVARDASLDEIKRSFRRLAKEVHPDLHPNNPLNARRFNDIAVAYDILSDDEKRRRYDRDTAGADETAKQRSEAKKSFEDGLDNFFGKGGAKARRGPDSPSFLRGADVHQALRIAFTEAVLGTRKRLVFNDQRVVDVVIPAGTHDGQTLRLKGQGGPGRLGRAAGDVLVEIQVDPHPVLTRRDRDILLTLPITVPEAVQGAVVVVPTVHGPVQLRIPAGSNTDTVLRLKGKGVPTPGGPVGDQYVTLKVVLPPGDDTEFSKIVEQWGRRRSYNVR
jgi:DnaJ-class molecular chaperone